MSEKILHSFEAGRRGKPDELDSNIANIIAAEFLEINPDARFDVRVHGGYCRSENKPKIAISGEVSDYILQQDGLDIKLSDAIISHYNRVHDTSLSSNDITISYEFKPQSSSLALNGHAGDSGNPIAVAYRYGPSRLPWERHLAVELRDIIDSCAYPPSERDKVMKEHSIGTPYEAVERIVGLKKDGKVGVNMLYDGIKPLGIESITIAAEHEEKLAVEELRERLGIVVSNFLQIYETRISKLARQRKWPTFDFVGNPTIIINGLGAWNQGGWQVDEGNREAKSYRDGFGTYGVMEDSFAGEDSSKPSATGTMLARYIAVNVVAKGLADFARVALTYTIGREEVGLNVTTNGTATVPQEEIHQWVREIFQLRIKDAVKLFGLKSSFFYKIIASDSDYFHCFAFPWNTSILPKDKRK